MFLTHEKYLELCDTLPGKYWKEGKNYRWKYISYVIDKMKAINPERICEAGSNGIKLNSESLEMDLPWYDLNKIPFKTLEGDILKDKFFDIFVALQVWEHLDNQQAAFKEVMRISKAAILSFPYKWKYGDKRHKNITWQIIKKWTCGVRPISTHVIKERAIYIWKF